MLLTRLFCIRYIAFYDVCYTKNCEILLAVLDYQNYTYILVKFEIILKNKNYKYLIHIEI